MDIQGKVHVERVQSKTPALTLWTQILMDRKIQQSMQIIWMRCPPILFVQQWRMQLQQYNFTILYWPSQYLKEANLFLRYNLEVREYPREGKEDKRE